MNKTIFTLLVVCQALISCAQTTIPASYSNISNSDNGLIFTENNTVYQLRDNNDDNTLTNMLGEIKGDTGGLHFNFLNPNLNGTLYYGFYDLNNKLSLPVFFKLPAIINNGKAYIHINHMKGKYDMVNWQSSKFGLLGYRIVNKAGEFLYDGKVAFNSTTPFKVAPTVIEGPYINKLTKNGATISFKTNIASEVSISVNNSDYKSELTTNHEIELNNLKPGTNYPYTVKLPNYSLTYTLKTAPDNNESFEFAYASDSRAGLGGGERDIYGANSYIMKRIMALNAKRNVAFMQFTGDLINGYEDNIDNIKLQYANWKHSTEPFSHNIPIYVGFGNHEALLHVFESETGDIIAVDKFPYETSSAEKVFSDEFVNFTNELISEDGSALDPTNNVDFPPYSETVFDYTYGNSAFVVLNSNYWYAPTLDENPNSSGGLHAYIMDNQLEWFKNTIAKYESDKDIEHIFVSQHTPCFPNGGHVKDDMWYYGNNDFRPYIAGKRVEVGIIERRDQILDLLVNKSTKFRAFLTGDEHNYVKTQITPSTNIYPENWSKPKLELSRSVWQINNGSAGAPYYAQEQTPWTAQTSNFSTQNVVVYFKVDGSNIKMEVINPDTFEKVDELELTE